VSAPPAPGADPFAAAAVVSKGESLAVKHCLATFFLREEVCWECPKEKALWRERRLSAAGSAGSAAGRVSIDGRVSLDGRPRVSFEGSSSMGPKAAGNTGGSTGGSAGLCAACSSKQQQQEGEGGGGGVVIAAPHPRLQQLLEGAENEDGAIYKQVSFSDREPQVRSGPSGPLGKTLCGLCWLQGAGPPLAGHTHNSRVKLTAGQFLRVGVVTCPSCC
jgi:hypothetical protein